MTFLIYTKQITNRCKFIFDLIFKENFGISYKIISNFQEFETLDGYKLNYSKKHILKVPFIYSSNLLFQRNIEEQEFETASFGNHPVIFATRDENSDLPFDIFAASFFLITRYEEYLPNKRDKYDRFNPKTSIAYKYKFLDKPLVNIWINQLKNILNAYYPNVAFVEKKFSFKPTFDIDIAYSFQNKGFFRSFGGFIADLRYLRLINLFKRFITLLNLKKDPYNTYEYIFEQTKTIKERLNFFFLAGNYGIYDKNINISNSNFKQLIKSIADKAIIGIHPSFASNQSSQILKAELHDLEEIVKKDITKSRQHYLRLEMPLTYENLIELDIKHDYTMGYASRIGFRASYCNSFYFYNLVLDIKTHLKINPFMLMDVSLKNYMKLTPEQAIEKSKAIIDITKKYNGDLVTLWHNSSLSETDGWKGWRKVFEAQNEMALQ